MPTYIVLGPDAEEPRNIFKPLLSVLLWLTERSRVSDVAIVLVQEFRDKVYILRYECLSPFLDEFGLWGIGAS